MDPNSRVPPQHSEAISPTSTLPPRGRGSVEVGDSGYSATSKSPGPGLGATAGLVAAGGWRARSSLGKSTCGRGLARSVQQPPQSQTHQKPNRGQADDKRGIGSQKGADGAATQQANSQRQGDGQVAGAGQKRRRANNAARHLGARHASSSIRVQAAMRSA